MLSVVHQRGSVEAPDHFFGNATWLSHLLVCLCFKHVAAVLADFPAELPLVAHGSATSAFEGRLVLG